MGAPFVFLTETEPIGMVLMVWFDQYTFRDIRISGMARLKDLRYR